MKLESYVSAEIKGRYKIVRADYLTDVPGDIIMADDDTGECTVHDAGETKSLNFGPRGLRIVGR